MTEKRKRAVDLRVSDADIDRAAASLLAASPSEHFALDVARRLRHADAPLEGLVPTATLRRWQLAFASLALLFVAVVVTMEMRQPRAAATDSRVASVSKPPVTEAPAAGIVVPAAPSPAPAPTSTRTPKSRVAPGRADETELAAASSFRRLVGPRLAERFVRKSSPSSSAAWDLMAPAQPDQAALDLLPDVAPIVLTPLPIPAPLLIPPIVIPELPIKGSRE